ncbi:MAG: acyloxyacyl hydrolase [Clostridiales bacterium]|nr:acyloxyacyl hydrolase [Clostridiales bacterium]
MNTLKINIIILLLTTIYTSVSAHEIDTVTTAGENHKLMWRIGAEATAAYVPGTNFFLRGNNSIDKRINSTISGDIKADFTFNSCTRQGALYKGVYQGIGIGMQSFFANQLLGTPATAYVYQGSPIYSFTRNLWLGYEWKFGAAMGWKHYKEDSDEENASVSTSITAMLALGLKLHYKMNDRWELSMGIECRHYSNGNTSWPNAGVNTIGATVGMAYTINFDRNSAAGRDLYQYDEEKIAPWFYDIVIYGAWRKRSVLVGDPMTAELCPGKFGVVGFQFSPMRRFNKYFAAGASLDCQWDESAGLEPYWVDWTYGDYIKFYRPPFRKQINLGMSAHAELIMPIFSVNAGLGYDIINPKGEKRFYQSLTLKTFVTKFLFLNVGYRLDNFKNPQNLMLGLGVRL